MKKYINLIVTLVLFFSSLHIINADFFEDTLELNYQEFNIQSNFQLLENQQLKDTKFQNQFKIIKKMNVLIKKAIIKKYKNGDFSYYKTNSLVRHYNNFIYYANQYFKSIKLQEKFGITKETHHYIYNNFVNMKSAYSKFKNILK